MRIIGFICFWLLSISVFGQSIEYTIRFIDQDTQKPISYAEIYVSEVGSHTYSNAMGFTQFQATKPLTILRVTHPNYGIKNIEVPETTQFTAQLKKEVSRMLTLNLADFPKDQVDPYMSWIYERMVPAAFGTNTIRAIYPDGFPTFYKELGNSIQLGMLTNDQEFRGWIRFVVDRDGTMKITETEGLDPFLEASVKSSTALLKTWKPAMVDSIPIEQEFLLPIVQSFESDVNDPLESEAFAKGTDKGISYWLSAKLSYPTYFRIPRDRAEVYLKFIVNDKGEVGLLELTKSTNTDVDNEVLYWFTQQSQWMSAMRDGRPVYQGYLLPVIYTKEADTVQYSVPPSYGFRVLPKVVITPESNSVRSKTNPEFRGGKSALEFYFFTNSNLKDKEVPYNDQNNSVYVSMNVTKEGSLTDLEITQSLGEPFDEEALRLVSLMPQWSPATQDGELIEKKWVIRVPFGSVSLEDINKSNDFMNRGYESLKFENYKRAIDLFTKSLELNERNIAAHYSRALILFITGDTENGCAGMQKIKDYNTDALKEYEQRCGN